MTRRVRRLAGAISIFLMLAPVLAYGQAGSTAQIAGFVRDTTGGVLPGADVTAIQAETGLRRTVVTDSDGSYVLSNLPIGPYRLEVSLAGFRTYAQIGIVLQVNASPTINVTLPLGDLTETVAVEAAAPLVETRSPGIGQVIENERIEELPLNGRQATDLIVLAGAAVQTSVATSRSMQGGVAVAVAGGVGFGVAYLLDGAMHNNPYDNLNLPLPFPDALQEFRVETSSTTANNGMHSGASVNAVTKSGTNLFHGDLFEFFRNHRFNATNPFNLIDPATGERRGDGLSRNQFGGTLGGPIATDRLFFFGAYQGTRVRETPADLFAFIPTAQMLAGDFTTAASAQCNATGSVTLRAPFVNNRIDASRFSRAALGVAGRLPQTTDPCGRVNYSRSRPLDEGQYIGKIDVQLNPNHTVFGRYMFTLSKQTPPLELQPDNLLVSTLGGRDNKAHSLTIGDTMVLSSTTVNSLRLAVNYTDIHRTHHPLGFDAPDLGIKDVQLHRRLHAAERDQCVQPGGRHGERGTVPDADLFGRRRCDDGAGKSPVRLWREPGLLEVALERQCPLPRRLHLQRFGDGPAAGRFPDRESLRIRSGGSEHRRHGAVVRRALRTGHVEVEPENDAELRRPLGARPCAAAAQRRRL